MTVLSDIVGGTFPLAPGEAPLNLDDLIEMGFDGRAYRARVTNYAAVANGGASIVAQTASGGTAPAGVGRPGLFQRSDTREWFQGVQNNGANTGFNINKLSPGGTLLNKLAVAVADTILQSFIGELSDGNMVAVYAFASTGALSFVIFDPFLNVLHGPTAIETMGTGNPTFGACTIAGGGFAVQYQQGANRALQRLAIYSNAGAAVFGPATVQTWTGTAGVVQSGLAQLSNGNLGLSALSRYTGTPGLYTAVYTTAGVQVAAFASLSATLPVGVDCISEIAVLPGFFAVCNVTATSVVAAVLDNTNALQGAAFTGATTQLATFPLGKTKVVADNTNTTFWLLWDDSNANTQKKITHLPTSGTGYQSFLTGLATSFNRSCDAYEEHGLLVGVLGANAPTGDTSDTTAMFALQPLSLSSGIGVVTPTTAIGTGSPTGDSAYVTALPAADFALGTSYDYGNIGQCFAVQKASDASIMGVAAVDAATLNDLVSVQPKGSYGGAGAFAITAMLGSQSVAFNHQSSHLPGNAGVMSRLGVVLEGMVA